ncbi:BRCA1-A complex subunit RAP80-like [Sinocyclocheilus grahami]|uniref:BRCA1-A complex subunit RAP80-like n=1 Tax=Sinocyclocheilus grahami TaxID=75366 RepID=UPI0007ACABA1|nr:PREDICTED: BRCA1-A complex subunit RAP80-like [Sinocyclocheilus grahami]
MPRRKRTTDEGGRRAKVGRVEHNEETLVISDSENEEEEDCSLKRSSRTTRWKRRENKSQLRDMTEEEMLNLAMRLSAQEANNASQKLQQEDNNVQKAITESLNDKTSDKQTDISNTPELFRSVSDSQSQTSPLFTRHGCFIRHPVVRVEKLSQDLIPASTDSDFHTQASAAATSPKQEDFKRKMYLLEDKDCCKNTNASEDDTQISDEDTHLPTQVSQDLSTGPDTCLSPSRRSSPKFVPKNSIEDVTVASKTPNLKQVEDQTTRGKNVKYDTETAPNTQSWNEFTSHMVLHLTDDEDDASEEVLSPSPVLCKEKIFKPIKTKLSPTQSCISPATITLYSSTQDTQMSRSVLEEDSKASKGVEFKSSDWKSPHSSVEKGECTISYYWGVPFCPMGQNPDEYTRVIMCQMEVYEKSLKEAQRELLHKAHWGQPVFPGSVRPFGARRWKRHRAPQLSEDEEEENEEEAEKENNRTEVEEEKDEAKESVVGSQEDAECGQSETYVVLSSPETNDEQVEKNPFLSREEPVTAALNKSFRKSAPWDTSDETQIQCSAEPEEEVAQNHKHCEEDEIICPETQMTQNNTPELMVTSPAQPQSHAGSEVMEGGGAPAVEEEMEQEAAPLHCQELECPMCSKLFPFSKIQIHAAYCDGEADHQEEQSQGPKEIDETQQSGNGLADPAVMGTSESVDCSAMTSCTSNAFTPGSENTDCLIDSPKNIQRLSRKRKFKKVSTCF